LKSNSLTGVNLELMQDERRRRESKAKNFTIISLFCDYSLALNLVAVFLFDRRG
jgi:hypothetical protein